MSVLMMERPAGQHDRTNHCE